VQEFTPLDPQSKKVGMYCCGPTVYDFAHIGNWRTFVFADLVRRTLEFSGYTVQHVMNITDVEDKIIKRVRENKTTLREFTGQFETAFLDDLKALGCREPHQKPRATEHIPEIIALIEKLVARGVAYKAADGSVYFSIDKYRGCGCTYGQLLKLNLDEMRAGERVASDEYEKESVADFALWKARVPDDGDVFWPSPFGEGRPGWHIECSAMATALLGPELDIHCGGVDNIFPHHEAEIAQSECCTGKKFVRHWLHCAHLMVDGRKMSKSEGNFYTLRDIIEKGYTGREVRYALITINYRLPLNFTFPGLDGCRAALARIDEWVARISDHAKSAQSESTPLSGYREKFFAALDEDLNIAGALSHLFDLIRETNSALDKGELTGAHAAQVLADWNAMNHVLAFDRDVTTIPAGVTALVAERQQARANKQWGESDRLRDAIAELGWIVKDTKEGPKLTAK